MKFSNYTENDYNAVCDFLIELNRADNSHINWNWARFEWMYAHPEFDAGLKQAIGLWRDGGRVVGAAIYDMYFGEAFCAALPVYETLYPEILDYANSAMKDENGLGIAIGDDNAAEIAAAKQAGFSAAEQTETVMSLELTDDLPTQLPGGLRFFDLDPMEQTVDFQWLLWQGFDHGTDRAEFEREDSIVPQARPHFDSRLSVAAENANGEKVAYCCLWHSDKTDYCYVEPVCVIPSYRGKGVGRAVVCEALNRARDLGAERAYVISDLTFYEKLGFHKDRHYTFYWKS